MRVFSGLFVTVLVSASANAQTSGRTALADVVAEALAKNPEIAAAQRRYDAARQRPAQERSLPDPMVSAGYNASGNRWPGAGLGTEPTANIGFMVSQELPYPGKRDLRASICLARGRRRIPTDRGRAPERRGARQAGVLPPRLHLRGWRRADAQPGPARHAPEGQRGPLRGRPGRAAGRHQGADAAQHPRAAAGTHAPGTRHARRRAERAAECATDHVTGRPARRPAAHAVRRHARRARHARRPSTRRCCDAIRS